ncbi:hypothetical protein R1sor_001786 [Riccia sorocarpa]|uniref:CMP/dCMP-type deaminase domain-containing protein n=1 Tax=Riccia sorocarpa TaxID=122646 RepID=A0ABD3H2V2_9MARC
MAQLWNASFRCLNFLLAALFDSPEDGENWRFREDVLGVQLPRRGSRNQKQQTRAIADVRSGRGHRRYTMDCSKEAAESPEALKFMRLAVIEAKQALARLEVPVGCVIVQNGEVIGHGSNRVNETRNATRHAEMEAIDMILTQWTPDQSILLSSQEQLKQKFSECQLYVTCEPCIMCAAALSILGIKKVYYGCANDRFGGCGSILPLHVDGCGGCGESPQSSEDEQKDKEKTGFECVGGILADEGVALLRGFYEQGNPNAPRPHRPVQVPV